MAKRSVSNLLKAWSILLVIAALIGIFIYASSKVSHEEIHGFKLNKIETTDLGSKLTGSDEKGRQIVVFSSDIASPSKINFCFNLYIFINGDKLSDGSPIKRITKYRLTECPN